MWKSGALWVSVGKCEYQWAIVSIIVDHEYCGRIVISVGVSVGNYEHEWGMGKVRNYEYQWE